MIKFQNPGLKKKNKLCGFLYVGNVFHGFHTKQK